MKVLDQRLMGTYGLHSVPTFYYKGRGNSYQIGEYLQLLVKCEIVIHLQR